MEEIPCIHGKAGDPYAEYRYITQIHHKGGSFFHDIKSAYGA